VLPRGGATAVGSVGYVLGAAEIGTHLPGATVWLATGSCGTQAGLVAGARAAGLGQVVGVTVSRPVQECRTRVLELGRAAAEIAGVPPPHEPDVDVRDGWVGAGYGVPSTAGRRAADLLARTEGVLVDPVFGAKALAALVDAASSSAVPEPVVFLVSGGSPTLLLSEPGG
jgi:D-cysteine desulfhydrase